MPKLPNIETKKACDERANLVILAIDPATHCGWAINKDVYGVWNLGTRKDESWGMKLVRMKAKLQEIHTAYKFNVIVYERPGGRNTQAIITQSKIIGVIETFCQEKDIDYRAYSSTEIKKFATGKGNCGKDQMIIAAKNKLGYPGEDDNEADALLLLQLSINELKPN